MKTYMYFLAYVEHNSVNIYRNETSVRENGGHILYRLYFPQVLWFSG
jgi:hypothetical protein